MRKRTPHSVHEFGLFVDAAPFEEDFANIKYGSEVLVKATTPRSLRQHKFAWALATRISEACDWLETKDDAMEYLLIEAKHFRRIYDPLRKIAHLRPKPTNWGSMDGAEYTRLLKRMTHVAITQVCPGLEDDVLRAEIEAMIGPDIQPEPPKRQRASQHAARKPAVGPQRGQTKGGAVPEVSEKYRVAPADSPPPEGRPEVTNIQQHGERK